MQIRVKCNCGEGNCTEWAIVELQGVVEAQPSFLDRRLQNHEIGNLCRPSSQEVYTFTVGYHELTGSKVPLKNPILVLKKIKHPDVDRSRESNCNVELQVIGIIRHRILFKTRPKALISRHLCHDPFSGHMTGTMMNIPSLTTGSYKGRTRAHHVTLCSFKTIGVTLLGIILDGWFSHENSHSTRSRWTGKLKKFNDTLRR